MTDAIPKLMTIPKPGLLRWEIGIALLIKIVLLTGLWFLIFRWTNKSVGKPDIAKHFTLTTTQTATSNILLPQAQKESRHDR